jgi:hypothetical protein
MKQTQIFYTTVLLFSFLTLSVGLQAQTHFVKVWSGNGVDHMNINLVTARQDMQDMQVGDEVGIFDGILCVGVGVLTAPLSMSNILPVTVSLNDGSGNGYTAGHDITYKFWDQSAGIEISPVTPTYYTNNPSWSSDGKFAVGTTAFVDLLATIPAVPETLSVSNETVSGGISKCFNATQTITVAGGGTAVVFEDGSTATLIAGQSIRFLPGFYAENGSEVHAWITTTGTFCDGAAASPVVLPEIKSTPEIQASQNNKQIIKEKKLKVYPNPNNGRFVVEISNFKLARISLYNLTGKRVFCQDNIAESLSLINLSHIPRGIYMIKVNDQEKQLTQKIVIN